MIKGLCGNALHEIEVPQKKQLCILLGVINHLLMNLFINDQSVKDHVDVIIDTYEDFMALLKAKISEDMKGQAFSVEEILGKSKRLLTKKNLQSYELKLRQEVKSKNFFFFDMAPEPQKFTILETPNSYYLTIYE